jgi:hypothetical protein
VGVLITGKLLYKYELYILWRQNIVWARYAHTYNSVDTVWCSWQVMKLKQYVSLHVSCGQTIVIKQRQYWKCVLTSVRFRNQMQSNATCTAPMAALHLDSSLHDSMDYGRWFALLYVVILLTVIYVLIGGNIPYNCLPPRCSLFYVFCSLGCRLVFLLFY